MTFVHICGILGVISGLVAAFYWYKASTIEAKTAWDYDPALKPKNIAEHNFGMVHALGAQQFWSGYYNKRAAIWTAVSLLFWLGTVMG
jgi:hypothetical protein